MSLSTPIWKQSWPFLLLTVFFVLGATYVKTFLRSRHEFHRAEARLKQGQIEAAIRQYGYTIRWYTPGNRYITVAARRLLKISELSYQRGDWDQTIMALQHLRNALAAIRSVYQPHAALMKQCQTRLAEAFSNIGLTGRTKSKRSTLRDRYLRILQRNPAPPAWRTLLAALLYALWVLSFVALIWYWALLSLPLRLLFGLSHLGLLALWMWALLA